MNFLDFPIAASTGDVAIVTLDHAANVRLLDDYNFSLFKSARQHRYFGGYYTVTPVTLTLPSSGRWHVVVDLGGYAGEVRASVSVQHMRP